MAILAQFNVLKFYTTKLARVWNKNKQSRCSELVTYQTGYVPSFSIAVLTSQVYPNQWRLKLYTSVDVEVAAVGTVDIDLVFQYDRDVDHYCIGYYGATFGSTVKGYYYILLTDGTSTYYSDVFGWDDTPDTYDETGGNNYMKVSVRSAPITVDPINNYTISMDEDIDFYLSASEMGIAPKIDQVGEERNAITDVIFGTAAFPHVFEIDANQTIYRYLYALGLLKANGTVTITYRYETYNATDILVEEVANHFRETYRLKLTFVDCSESVQMSND